MQAIATANGMSTGGSGGGSRLFPPRINAIAAGLALRAKGERNEIRRHAEADDDSGEHQRLRQRIGVRLAVQDQRRPVDDEPPLANRNRFTA
jgi:hypothetical protein